MEWLREATVSGLGGSFVTLGTVDILGKAAVVLLAALGLTSALRRRASASTRHQVWTVALVSVLALPVLALTLPAWQLPLLPAGLGVAQPPDLTDLTDLTDIAPRPDLPLPSAADGIAGLPEGAAPAPFSVAGAPQTAETEVTTAPGSAEPRPAARIAGPLGSTDAIAIIAAIWIAGTIFLLGRLALSMAAAWWITHDAEPLTDEGWLRAVRTARQRLGMSSGVVVARSVRTSMPMAWGLLRPAVLLPGDCPSWSPERRTVVLLHEIAHLKRRDCQTLLLGRFAAAFYWINPLVWIANRRLHAERERACDDLVLDAGTRGSDYAQHLLEIARSMQSSRAPGWAAVAMARPNELEGRLLRILDPGLNRRRATRSASLAAVALVSSLVLPLAALQPRASTGQVGGKVGESSGENAAGTDVAVESFAEEDIDALINVSIEDLGGLSAELGEAPAIEPPQQRDPRIYAALAGALHDEDPQIRQQAAHSLGNLENPAAVEALSATLTGDEEAGVREAAAWALGMIEDPAAVAPLGAAMDDESPRVREQAAWALGMIEDAGAVAALTSALSDSERRVREQAAWALGMIESADAVEGLSAAARGDEAWQVREQAVWALGMIEDESALDAVLDAMTDEHLEVRKQALWAVGMIAG